MTCEAKKYEETFPSVWCMCEETLKSKTICMAPTPQYSRENTCCDQFLLEWIDWEKRWNNNNSNNKNVTIYF